MSSLDGTAIVYCEGAFQSANGKTAHGLVRFTKRYKVAAVIDSTCAGADAGLLLDGKSRDIPVVANLIDALEHAAGKKMPATHFVIGLAPDGGKLGKSARTHVMEAITSGLHVDSGLHDFLTIDQEITKLAARHNVKLRDVRKPPPAESLHFFSGKITEVNALKIAVLGTDSAVGKRTTAWMLIHGLESQGIASTLVGTGQTAWMQGAPYGVVMDALVNDFVSGEIEHAVWAAWKNLSPKVIAIEGQGSLMNPAYPGGFEIIAGGRPDILIMQHAPARKFYDGFPDYAIQPLAKQIQVAEMISDRPVVAITVNHEDLAPADIPYTCKAIENAVGIPAFDVAAHGADDLVKVIKRYVK